MDAIKNILTRRSIRKFTEQAVSDDMIKKLIEAGVHAPSARNFQPWHFIVLSDKDKMKKITEVHPNAGMLSRAPLGILVCGDMKLQDSEGYMAQDLSAVTQNILLAAHAHGLGSVWLGVFPRQERIKGIREILEIPDHILPFSLIAIGYPAEEKDPPQRYNAERVHRNKF